MAHELLRIKSKLQNTPHLVDQTTFAQIMEYIEARTSADVPVVSPDMKSGGGGSGRYDDNYNPDTKTGVMYIEGPLSYKPVTMFGFECGGTSYMGLKEQMELLVQKGATTVAMIADSGGGEAHGMMDSGNYIRKLADENGIKLLAYVDGTSASACYGLTCIADEIILSADSMVGSIGVLIQLVNDSEALKKAGYERTFITAGADKVPFDADGAFTDSFKERLQGQVDTLYEGFTAHVAGHRGMSIEAVKATKAQVFLAQEAIELGLADSIMTVEDFYSHLADVAQSTTPSREVRPTKFQTTEEQLEMTQVAELQGLLAQKELALTAQTSQLAELTSMFEEQGAKLEAAMATLTEIQDAQASAALDARRTKLSAVLPADKVEGKLSAFASLDDASFGELVDTLQAAKDAVASGSLMSEAGNEGSELEEPKPAAAAHQSTADRIAARLAAKSQ